MRQRTHRDMLLVIEAAEAIISIAEPRKSMDYKRSSNAVKSESTQNTVYIIPDEETASFATGLLKSLSTAAAKLAIQIGDELKMNNALWFFDHEYNRSAINALKELREKKVLFPMSNKVWYVNPLCIRKGNAVNVAEKTKEILLHHKGACKEAIIALNGKLNGVSSPFHSLTGEPMDIIPDFLQLNPSPQS